MYLDGFVLLLLLINASNLSIKKQMSNKLAMIGNFGCFLDCLRPYLIRAKDIKGVFF